MDFGVVPMRCWWGVFKKGRKMGVLRVWPHDFAVGESKFEKMVVPGPIFWPARPSKAEKVIEV